MKSRNEAGLVKLEKAVEKRVERVQAKLPNVRDGEVGLLRGSIAVSRMLAKDVRGFSDVRAEIRGHLDRQREEMGGIERQVRELDRELMEDVENAGDRLDRAAERDAAECPELPGLPTESRAIVERLDQQLDEADAELRRLQENMAIQSGMGTKLAREALQTGLATQAATAALMERFERAVIDAATGQADGEVVRDWNWVVGNSVNEGAGYVPVVGPILAAPKKVCDAVHRVVDALKLAKKVLDAEDASRNAIIDFLVLLGGQRLADERLLERVGKEGPSSGELIELTEADWFGVVGEFQRELKERLAPS